MRLRFFTAMVMTVSIAALHHPAIAAPKTSAQCLSSSSGVNKKLPSAFDDVFAKRACLPFAAWQRMAKTEKSNTRTATIEIIIGPNTKPWYRNPAKASQVVSTLFPNSEVPELSYFIYYNFKDTLWAKKKLQSLVSANEFENFSRNENGRVTESNCEEARKDCFGSKALTAQSGNGFILLGVPNALNNGDPVSDYRFKAGMLEAHEYFHLLQDIPLVGKNLEASDWPPRWVTEGGAEYIQNGAIHRGSFSKYLDFRSRSSGDLYGMKWLYTQKYLEKYLRLSITGDDGSQYDPWLAYNLGSRFIEILVALRGQESLITLNKEMATKIGFAKAFENVYGFPWDKAVPILAKVVSADISNGL
jgi:hypothetical protein